MTHSYYLLMGNRFAYLIHLWVYEPVYVLSFSFFLQRVLEFLSQPHRLWLNGNLEQRRIVQSLLFTDPIEYSSISGFGTTNFSFPFKLLQLEMSGKIKLGRGEHNRKPN